MTIRVVKVKASFFESSVLARCSNNLILKTRLSFLLCAAAIVKMVYYRFERVGVSVATQPDKSQTMRLDEEKGKSIWCLHGTLGICQGINIVRVRQPELFV